MGDLNRAEKQRRLELYAQGMKRCGGCFEALPIDRFQPNARGWMGLRSYCRNCGNASTLERQSLSPETTNARVRRWCGTNRERSREIGQQYRDSHPIGERLRNGRRRASMIGLPADDITEEALLADWERRGIDPNLCVYTGERLQDGWHLDHMDP